MDATLPIALTSSSQAVPLDLADTPPWEIEADDTPPPVRAAPRKIVHAARRTSERIHWSVTALTVLTAVVLVFTARAEKSVHSWEIASAVRPN